LLIDGGVHQVILEGLLYILLFLTFLLAVSSLLGMPLLLRFMPARTPTGHRCIAEPPRGLSLIVPLHGSAAVLVDKLDSLRGLHWRHGSVELILSLDGEVTDMPLLTPDRVSIETRILQNPRQGKFAALNAAAGIARGELLIFSDLDARLAPGAVEAMAECFSDQSVGAACGRIQVIGADALMQTRYWEHEAVLKSREERLFGSITASNGTLLAIRRQLFEPVPAGVVDDLFIGLTAVMHGYRFAFVPDAVVLIGPPAETLAGVFRRQRRIVCRGLAALRLRSSALSLRRHGRYALALLMHKVLRRMFPLAVSLGYLLIALLSLVSPTGVWPWCFAAVTLALSVAILMTLSVGLHRERRGLPGVIGVIPWALCVNAGITMGWLDFFSGRQVTKW
jgi:cellulose synthase/poly-beta-1,6-N-acetylglucosamine synthase-like glycosyltransferase